MSSYEFFRVRDLERDIINQHKHNKDLEEMLKYLCRELVSNNNSEIIKKNKRLKEWWKTASKQ